MSKPPSGKTKNCQKSDICHDLSQGVNRMCPGGMQPLMVPQAQLSGKREKCPRYPIQYQTGSEMVACHWAHWIFGLAHIMPQMRNLSALEEILVPYHAYGDYTAFCHNYKLKENCRKKTMRIILLCARPGGLKT